jgi:hypothetical protein
MAKPFGLDEEGGDFSKKKHKTSFMRRLAPEGMATTVLWTANVRTLRYTIEARTAAGAEEEIRLVFGKIGTIMRAECPAPFGDYTVEDGAWIPKWRKGCPDTVRSTSAPVGFDGGHGYRRDIRRREEGQALRRQGLPPGDDGPHAH